ncbi:hypothetical protein ACH5RR_029335 [Cinchona calisaya]|uniref:Reverse transcriptase/retrotransposon-derived protein RNase H-like domain-containing protein n=1 Tax=Cinchona calisaya TaxID=153742 RepID=A0ABD2YUS1_9GENT
MSCTPVFALPDFSKHFTLETDASNKAIGKITIPFQHKWLTKLMELDYEVQYKRGKENIVTDTLSIKVAESYNGDAKVKDLLLDFAVRNPSHLD